MSSSQKIRVRFAPSPTGYLHIGGARTALYNYLLAKKHGGTFILRIEDTDRERSTDASIEAIFDGMKWLGLTWDEGPYFQTQRYDLYHQAVDQLLATGNAYRCFCTEEELTVKREKAQAEKIKYKYDRTCHQLTEAQIKQKLAENLPHCIRFYSRDDEDIIINDLIKGEVRVAASELDDLVIRRTDGNPTYNLTVVIDDALMEITHVIRGDDHLNNTPRQIQLYRALGYPLPQFAHVSMILGDDKKRLSKRHGATSVMAYKDMGYLPQAILNYLVRLGWSYQDQEIFSLQEMIDLFSFDHVSSSQAIFNTSKLIWLNGHYIRVAQPAELFDEVKRFLIEMGAQNIDDQKLLQAIQISQEKVKDLRELAEFVALFFMDVAADETVLQKNITAENRPLLLSVFNELTQLSHFDRENIHAVFEKIMAEKQVALGKIAGPLRAALSGKKISPGVYDLLVLFGKDKSLEKLSAHIS